MILAKDIKKRFIKERDRSFFLNIDFLEIKRNEYVSLIGPDGAGKSTLIKIICGLMPYDSGELRVAGFNIPTEFYNARIKIGYLSQTFTLYRNLTVYENIEYFASLFNIENKRKKIKNILEMVGLLPFKDRLSKDLSGGMKQKLSIACAIIRSPELLLLDEPTTGVDPLSRREIFSIIEEMNEKGITVLFSTSYMDEAERAKRVIMMNNGHIIGDYKTADILDDCRYNSIEQFFIKRIQE